MIDIRSFESYAPESDWEKIMEQIRKRHICNTFEDFMTCECHELLDIEFPYFTFQFGSTILELEPDDFLEFY